MRLGRRIERAFFARPCPEVARELVGATLVRLLPGGARLVGRLVEVEAYLGDGSDPGSHSHHGVTPRNSSMFGPPGQTYAYRSYGLHTCINLVCEPQGTGAAVLLRALEPLEGVAAMRSLRGRPGADGEPPDARRDRDVARGPGRLAQALGLGLDCDGQSSTDERGPFRLYQPRAGAPRPRIESSPRVGLTRAADLPYRFFESGSPWVSTYRRGGKSDRSRAKSGARKPANQPNGPVNP